MGKVHYYSNEIEDRLRQVDINRNDIGMTQINALPLPEGVWDDSQVDIPDTMELTTEGDKATGTVTVSVSGTAPDTENLPVGIYSFKLSPTGRGTGAIGIIKPGKYLLSLGGSASVADMPWELPDTTWYPEIYANVIKPDGTFESYHVKCFDDAVEVVIPEDVAEVEIQLYLYFDYFTNVTASCELYPFLRLKALADEPFEPYKPDLQTQINDKASTSDMTAGFDRITDTLGTEGSINLFPIDKGSRADPLEVVKTNGTFYIAKGYSSSYLSFIMFSATSTESVLEQEEIYETCFNSGYDFDDDSLYGDLMPGDYLFSFDVDSDRQNFTTHGKFSYKIYQGSTPGLEDELIATCEEGQTVNFTVTSEKPYIRIAAFAEKFENQSWEGDYIITYPFLRHAFQINAQQDIYKPSLYKQICDLKNTISKLAGYSETQVNNIITDRVSEVEV